MNNPMMVLGVSPSLAHFGYAVVAIGAHPENDRLVDLGAIRTERSAKKLRVREIDDDSRRAREIAKELSQLLIVREPKLICARAFISPMADGDAVEIARAWGVLCALSFAYDESPILQSTPQEIKLAVCKVGTATKYDVRNALLAKFDANKWLNLPDDIAEHGIDALGAVVAAEAGEPMKMLRSYMR